MTEPAYDAFRNRLESGGDEDAYNPRSGALGKHQFLASTWLGLVRRHRPAWADGLSDAQILDKRRDGAISDAMVALFDRGNTEQLAAAGYAATPGNLYLAHHFGAAGAKKILGAADDTPMQSLVSRAAWRANPHLRGKTKAQLLADFARRGGAPAAFAASAQSATAQAPATGPARTAAYTPFTPMAQARNSNAAPMPIWRPTPLPASSPVPPLAPTPAPAAYALPTATPPIPDARTRPVTAFDPTAPRPDPPAESVDPPANEPTPLEQLLRMLR